MKTDLKIYYIYHSCFIVESRNYLLVFDYYQSLSSPLKDLIFSTDKKVFVFCSHSHFDHFNSEIFDWKNKYSFITYILSNDITLKTSAPNIHLVSENSSLSIDDMALHIYGSTDLGVSYLIDFDGHRIFHAGDLNWWYWKDDTSEEEKSMRESFQNIISKIDRTRIIDFAFFPIDPRLEEYAFLGGEYFVEKLSPRYLVPMHFDESYSIMEKFKNRISHTKTSTIIFNRKNQRIYP